MDTDLPELGSGLGYRAQLDEAIAAHADRIDWLEVISEHFMFAPPERREKLRSLAERFPIVPHGIELSVGSPGPLDADYVDALATLVAEVDAPWFSDHLCFTRTDEVALSTLVPLPRTLQVARAVARKARQVQRAVGAPLLLENITDYLGMAAPLTEAQFICEVLEHCECGLLLDLANLDINARNHAFDPVEFLENIPLERVVQVHLAGGIEDGPLAIDSHSTPVPPGVWALLRELRARAPVRASLLERDQDFPDDFGTLLADINRARAVLTGQSHALPGREALDGSA
ncbi:DUF692 domain-containing protein [Nonomuraea purpurea]|uniref:DUF692 domain-containing protein n=1 Tax=Nonomuraea purpurea TaxID=1849276 RepID=A0ABV8GQ89_9ACTN